MFERILAQARGHERDIARFLRDLIAIRSLSAQEGDVIRRVEAEMNACGYDEVRIDPMGNILGRIRHGPRILALDAHVDTVDVGNPANWLVDPFEGDERNGIVYGRGACDMKGALASIVYGGRIIKELGLEGGCTLWVVGSRDRAGDPRGGTAQARRRRDSGAPWPPAATTPFFRGRR